MYTIEDIAKDQSDLCDKISEMITEFESKYGVAVVELDYDQGEYTHHVDMTIRLNRNLI